LLLGDAVNVAAAQKDFVCWHAYDLAIWEKLLQGLDGSAVMEIVECGYYNTAVGDIKVDV